MRSVGTKRCTHLLVMVLVLTACRADIASTSEPIPTAPTPDTSTETPDQAGTGDVSGFPIDVISLDGVDLEVAVADNPGRRSKGLRHVEDFGALSGMLFVFGGPVNAVFTMEDTPTPLDLILLEDDGTVMEILPMDPCGGNDCRFPPTVVYHYALEVPQGSLDVAVGDRFLLP